MGIMSSEGGFRSNYLSTEVTIVWLFHSTNKKIVNEVKAYHFIYSFGVECIFITNTI